MGEGFPRVARLTNTAEFSAVFGCRCVVRSAHLSVFAKPHGGATGRLGIAVSRRVAARAVDRNTMKRLIREAFRRHGAAFSGIDVVVVAQRKFPRGDYPAIETELLTAVGRVRQKCLAA